MPTRIHYLNKIPILADFSFSSRSLFEGDLFKFENSVLLFTTGATPLSLMMEF